MRFRKICAAGAALVVTFAAQSMAHAHFLWATVQNGQARFALLENVAEAPNTQFATYVANLSPRSGKQALRLGDPENGARYGSLPTGETLVSVQNRVGVRDREGQSYLLVYDAKGAASLEAARGVINGPAEITARRDGNDLVVCVRQEGWPVPGCPVWAQMPGQATAPDTTSGVQTDLRGEARIPYPAALPGGFVGVRAQVTEPTPGEADGKKYTTIRHWATLTFPTASVATASAASITNVALKTAAPDKPFRQVLRAAFANNHDVVGNAAFNNTLFAGKLTRAQLETHLQQRALIHNETHRILNGSESVRSLYGPVQKNVLVLLFDDLINMGSGWPTEAQAHPLTKAFLSEIRDSEKRGPYFALGVWHIYYGGITNGGRMIGEKMGETVHITPTYYEKSDGYPDYLTQVDTITDPAAQAEMIRGGQAAYRYIIAISNDPMFR